MSRSKGFTIIELMIVVTVIGILVAVAIPAYTTYTVRAKVADGLVVSAPAKRAIEDYYYFNGAYPADNAQAGLQDPAKLGSKFVRTVEVAASGVIVVTFGDPALLDQTLRFTPTAEGTKLTWSCSSSLSPSLLPSDCRP